MAYRDLNVVKLCYAEATWLYVKIECEPVRRRADETQLAEELSGAEKKLHASLNAQTRKQASEAAVTKITSIATAAFDGHVQSFNARIAALRARRPTEAMVAALDLIQVRIQDLEREVMDLQKKFGGTPLLNALAQQPAVECRTVNALVCTCEQAANSVRGWLGSRRDWTVALVVAVLVGLALIPATLMISDWWSAKASHEVLSRDGHSEQKRATLKQELR